MADEDTSQGEPGGTQGGSGAGGAGDRDDRRRQKLTERATAAESKASDLEKQLEEANTRLEALEGKGQSIDKVVETKDKAIDKLKAQLTDRDKKIEELTGTINARDTKDRRRAFVDRLVTETKLPVARIEGLLSYEGGLDPDFETAPVAVTDTTVKDALTRFKKSDPGSFEAREGGPPRSRPGPAAGAGVGGLPRNEQPNTDEATYWENRGRNANSYFPGAPLRQQTKQQ